MPVFLRRPRAPGCSHWPIRQRSVCDGSVWEMRLFDRGTDGTYPTKTFT